MLRCLQKVKSASWHKDGAQITYCRMNKLCPLRDRSDHILMIIFFCFLVEFFFYHVLWTKMSFYIESHCLHLLKWSPFKSDVFSASSLFRSSCSLWSSSMECRVFCVPLPHLFMTVGWFVRMSHSVERTWVSGFRGQWEAVWQTVPFLCHGLTSKGAKCSLLGVIFWESPYWADKTSSKCWRKLFRAFGAGALAQCAKALAEQTWRPESSPSVTAGAN